MSFIAVSSPVSTGVHCTRSMRGAPVASITSRSRPSATPLASRHFGERRQEILVDRIALAVDPRLLVHLGGETAALLAGSVSSAKPLASSTPQA